MPFHRNVSRPPGAGLTYCAGFDLAFQAEISVKLVIEVEQRQWGGNELHPPRKLLRQELQVSPEEVILGVSTDDGALGHPCAEVFRVRILAEAGETAEFEITETQSSRTLVVVNGRGWIADYPELTGPGGLHIQYRPRHGYLD